jgi:hypothetical protein
MQANILTAGRGVMRFRGDFEWWHSAYGGFNLANQACQTVKNAAKTSFFGEIGNNGRSRSENSMKNAGTRCVATLRWFQPTVRGIQPLVRRIATAHVLRRRYATQCFGAASSPWVKTHGYHRRSATRPNRPIYAIEWQNALTPCPSPEYGRGEKCAPTSSP